MWIDFKFLDPLEAIGFFTGIAMILWLVVLALGEIMEQYWISRAFELSPGEAAKIIEALGAL